MSADELKAYKVMIIGTPTARVKEEDGKNVKRVCRPRRRTAVHRCGQGLWRGGFAEGAALGDAARAQPGAQMTRAGSGLHARRSVAPGHQRIAAGGPHTPVLSWTPVKVSELSTTLIATADGLPILVVRRCGQGRVAMILSDSPWRWQWRRGRHGKGTVQQFVTQLVHWLAPSEKEVEKTGLLQVSAADSGTARNVTLGAVGPRRRAGRDPLQCRIINAGLAPARPSMVPCSLGMDVGLTKSTNGSRMFRPTYGEYRRGGTPNGSQEQKLRLLATTRRTRRPGAAGPRLP